MSLKLNSSGGGSVLLQEPTTASNLTLNLPAVNATVITDSSGILNIGSGQVYKDASGNVGIGISSPAVRLHVSDGSTGLDNGTIRLGNNPTYYGQIQQIYNNNELRFSVVGGGQFQTFYTNGSERARIDSSGNLLVGTASQLAGGTNRLALDYSVSDYVQRINNSNASPFGLLVTYSGASPNNTGSQPFYFQDSGSTQRFSVRSNGGIYNYSANNVNLSDRREKTNFAPAGDYLSKICAIPVQTFNYIDQNREEDDGLTLGVVAQDVEAVAPELVTESNWGTEESPKMRLSIYQTDLQYALMKCIQEQQTMIEELKAKVAALEAK